MEPFSTANACFIGENSVLPDAVFENTCCYPGDPFYDFYVFDAAVTKLAQKSWPIYKNQATHYDYRGVLGISRHVLGWAVWKYVYKDNFRTYFHSSGWLKALARDYDKQLSTCRVLKFSWRHL